MAIVLKTNKAALIENGAYVARIARIIDMGIQPQEFKGEQKTPAQMVDIAFELPTERILIKGEDKPRWVSKQYKADTSDKSNLTKLLNAVDTNRKIFNGDLENLLGLACMVTIGTTSTGKNNTVTGVSPLMKGMEVADLYTNPVSFSIDNPDADVWLSLPEWMKETIRGAEEFPTSPLAELDEQTKGDA